MSVPQKSSRWGSFLSQAVAGVEARLDNILAEEESAKQPPSQRTTRTPSTSSGTAPAANVPHRSTTPSRSTNDRLQERLARAVAAKNAAQKADSSPARLSTDSAPPSQSPRTSSDISNAASAVQSRPSIEKSEAPKDDGTNKASTASVLGDAAPMAPPTLAANTEIARDILSPSLQSDNGVQAEKSPLPTIEPEIAVSAQLSEAETAASTSALYEQRIADLEKSLEETNAQHQEELHSHVERVDALEAKLRYLARQASDAARSAATAAPAGSMEKKLAEKDQQIAQLMEEGQKLANTEQKHRSIIKKLRGQLALNEKELNEQKLWRQKAENEMSSLRRN